MRSWNVSTAEPWRGHFLPYLHRRQRGLNLKEMAERVKVEINFKQERNGWEVYSWKKWQKELKLKEMSKRIKVERNARKGD
jgi:hypothetical protein